MDACGCLASDLEQYRQKEESQQTESKNLTSQSQAMMSLQLQLQSTVVKAQAKAIDLELRKLDAQQATEHLSYVQVRHSVSMVRAKLSPHGCIQAYLPDSFFSIDNDPIRCLLLFKRLAFKSDLLGKYFDPSNSQRSDDSEEAIKFTQDTVQLTEVHRGLFPPFPTTTDNLAEAWIHGNRSASECFGWPIWHASLLCIWSDVQPQTSSSWAISITT